ncbi:MAG: PAS domain S-box protein [Burkholderiaceae bacterium]|nr:PAS domain S-box protein [Burkholderiaceae bacterium]
MSAPRTNLETNGAPPSANDRSLTLSILCGIILMLGVMGAALFDVLHSRQMVLEESRQSLRTWAELTAANMAHALAPESRQADAAACTQLQSLWSAGSPIDGLTFELKSADDDTPACTAPQTIQGLSEQQIVEVGVPGHALRIEARRTRTAVLATWRYSALHTLVRAMLVLLAALLLLLAVLHQQRRQSRNNLELRAGEQRWRAVFDHAPVGIVMLPPNMAYLVANPAFLRMVGYSLDELKHLTPDNITHPDDIALTRTQVDLLARDERTSVHFEKRYVHRDGHVIWTEISISRLTDSGELNGILVAIVDDVSERRATEEARRRLETQLRQSQKLEALGTFAGGIAHDFNNILSAILGYGERAARTLDRQSPARHDLQQVLNAGARAKALVQRILTFSRSGVSARMPLQVEPVLTEALELVRAGLAPDVRIELSLAAPGAHIMGDATQLHQVVMNLCSNAVHALQDTRGVVTVSTSIVDIEQTRNLSSGLLTPGPYICISVADTGVGISPTIQERMFDPFFTTRQAGDGTGLGLSLVDGIIRDGGGAIEVESVMGQGSNFKVYLPLTSLRPDPMASAGTTLPAGQGQIVLVVDDERVLMTLCEDLLAELGYEPVGFTSAELAFAEFETDPQRFDLVLSDQSMQGMTGLDLLRRVRQICPDLPLLLMSGQVSQALEDEAKALGIRTLLRKPFDRVELASALQAALQP